jgi:hypothetical protein
LFTMTSFGELSDVMMTAKKNDVHIASMNSWHIDKNSNTTWTGNDSGVVPDEVVVDVVAAVIASMRVAK